MRRNFVGILSNRTFFLTLVSLLFFGFVNDTKAATSNWMRLPVSRVNDVAVDSLGIIYITKTDGTTHYSVNGTFYIQIPTPLPTIDETPSEITTTTYTPIRIAVAPNNIAWAIFTKNTTTRDLSLGTVNAVTTRHLYYLPTPARGWIERVNAPEPADVATASDGRIIIASATPPYSLFSIINITDPTLPFLRINNTDEFSRVSAGNGNVIWGVKRDGTLWKFVNNTWTQTSSVGISDVGASHSGRVIGLVEQKNMTYDGALWVSSNAGDTFAKNLKPKDCQSVAASSTGHLYVVNLQGILFKTRFPIRSPPGRRRPR